MALLVFAGIAGGCASGTPPLQDIKTAKMTILNAQEAEENADARRYFESAKSYLEKAQKKMDEKAYDEARLLAQKATADARVAKIKAQNSVLQKEVDALDLELKKLRREFVTIDEEKGE
jgi:dynactin complex subunit